MGKRYKVIFDREVCIGALSCAVVNRVFWLESDDGKVDLKDATLNAATGKWELVIDEKDLKINEQSVKVCPVEAIVIVPLDE